MKICLLRPPMLLAKNSLAMRPTQPLGLAYIAGAIRECFEDVYIIDAVAEDSDHFFGFDDELVGNGLEIGNIVNQIDPDTTILGISCMFSCNWLLDKAVIEAIKQAHQGIIIISGGEHITALPEHCLSTTNGLDICVLGEGEETIVEVIRCIDKGLSLANVEGIVYKDSQADIVRTPPRKRVRNIDELPWPAWDLFPMIKYFDHKLYYGVETGGKSLPILATRGCPFQCTFCSSPDMWGTRYYMRTPESLLDEIIYRISAYLPLKI